MESLLCDETWLHSPVTTFKDCSVESQCDSFGMSKEDNEQALSICLEEEIIYIPEHNYIEYLCSNNLIIARFKSIQWFIKCKSRLDLSFETVFYAANYLDRFISLNPCNEWQYWMVELLSIACLSVAAKFNDTITPTLHEIQMDGLDHLFQPSTIQRMEVIMLQALEWRLAAKTAYSFVELFTWNLDSMPLHLHQELIVQVNELLLGAISDTKLLQFRPSVVAVSALLCCLDKLLPTSTTDYHSYLTRLFNQCQKNDLMKCHKMMEEQSCIGTSYNLVAEGYCYYYYYSPSSSPTTVLLMKEKEGINICEFHADLSLFQMRASNTILQSSRKEQRREE